MADIYNVEVHGIILDTSLIKEYDKRLMILTAELGRITVFANGARRKNSMLTAVSQKFVMGTFTLRPSRDTYTLISANVTERFEELTRDIDALAYASYACEVAGYFVEDGVGAKDELNLLYVTFKAIILGRLNLELIRAIFMCKLLDVEGERLEMSRCVKSGVTTDLKYLSISEGGLLTGSVYRSMRDSIAMNPHLTDDARRGELEYFDTFNFTVSQDAIYTLRYIFSRKLAETYSFSVSDALLSELKQIASAYLKKHADRHFKSLDILKPLV